MPSSFPSPEEVEKEARSRAAKLFESHEVLRTIIERHELTLRTRWGKKSNAQKKKDSLRGMAWHVVTASIGRCGMAKELGGECSRGIHVAIHQL